MSRGIRREELWITSKLWNDKHGEADVVPSCRKSLADLGLDYLDTYLVHWPFPNYHPPGCDVSSRSDDARPYLHKRYLATWRQMERLVELGLVRHIGTSNRTIPKLQLLHPHFQQPESFDFVRGQGIEPIGFCPLGSPNRPQRDRTPEDTSPLEDPVRDRRGPRRPSRRRLPQVGGPAWADSHPLLDPPRQPAVQPEGRGVGSSER